MEFNVKIVRSFKYSFFLSLVPYVLYEGEKIAYGRDGYEKTEYMEEENTKQDVRTSGRTRNKDKKN